MWRTTPMHRRETSGSVADHRPPPLEPEVERAEIQAPADGVGPLFTAATPGDPRAGPTPRT